jgi:predicted short-subunit dehydrogenase-like oxidoreductase (DUF2520 family)
MNRNSLQIVMIGAGNLSTHLSKRLQLSGHQIVQVYSRTLESATSLASKLQSKTTIDLSEIFPDADIYFICVSDKAVTEVLQKMNTQGKLIIHTSGSLDIDVLQPFSHRIGVFYPIQTFSKLKPVNFDKIPVCIEANSMEVKNLLIDLASQISGDVREINSLQRRYIHLAAVFASNFTNHLFALSNEILAKQGIEFNILHPLVIETVDKAIHYSPINVQTGPAIRNDENVMNKHLDMLSDSKELQKIYALLSENIYKYSTSN